MADVGNDTVAAVRLGGIEGAVGKPQQVVGIAMLRVSRRHADAYGDVELVAVDGERFGSHPTTQPFGSLESIRHVGVGRAMANSSPPRRPTMSLSRTTPRQRSAMARNT